MYLNKKNKRGLINNFLFFNLFNYYKLNFKFSIVNFYMFIFGIHLIFNFFYNINKNFLFFSFLFTHTYYYFKYTNYIVSLRILIFNYIKYIFIIYFFFFKKNIKSLFFLNFYNNLNYLYFSIKNIFNSSLSNLLCKFNARVYDNKLKFNINLFHNKNINNFFKNFYNLYSNIIFNNKLVNLLLNINFFFSFFLIWKFLFLYPISNLYIYFNSNTMDFFNIFLSKNILKNFFKNNFLIFKYINFFNFYSIINSHSDVFRYRVFKFKVYRFIKDSHFSDLLVRFVEYISKLKALIYINKSLYQQLTFDEWLRFDLLRRRFRSSVRVQYLKLNTRFLQQPISYAYGRRHGIEFYWFEITLVCFMTYKLKDTTILLTYLNHKMSRMSLFKHRRFLKRVFFILRVLFYEIGPIYHVEGIKIKLIGKISVTGNARTRTMHFKEGLVSNSNMKIRADYNYNIIKTNTGCLGLSIWLFY